MQSKPRLNADDLVVEPFNTGPAPRAAGAAFAGPRRAARKGTGYTCQGCTAYEATCRNIGTCNPWAGFCADIP